MQSIQTKFIGPTNTKGSRVRATCWLGGVTLGWNHALNQKENHLEALQAMCDKMNDSREGDLKWGIVATGESVDGKGCTAIINLA